MLRTESHEPLSTLGAYIPVAQRGGTLLLVPPEDKEPSAHSSSRKPFHVLKKL